jgi:hypothetical protein
VYVTVLGDIVLLRNHLTAVAAAITFAASGAALTPLYHEYQQRFGLMPFMITIIFAAYVLCLLLALLTVGRCRIT